MLRRYAGQEFGALHVELHGIPDCSSSSLFRSPGPSTLRKPQNPQPILPPHQNTGLRGSGLRLVLRLQSLVLKRACVQQMQTTLCITLVNLGQAPVNQTLPKTHTHTKKKKRERGSSLCTPKRDHPYQKDCQKDTNFLTQKIILAKALCTPFAVSPFTRFLLLLKQRPQVYGLWLGMCSIPGRVGLG